MIYICAHTKPLYSLECPNVVIDNNLAPFPDDYRMLRGIWKVWHEHTDEEVGIFQYRKRLLHLSIPEGYDCVAGPNWCPVDSIWSQYERHHTIENLAIAEKIIDKESFSKYIRIKNNQECYWDNMFIMRRTDFNDYCEFLFDTLRQKDAIRKDAENDWLAERLTSWFICDRFDREKILRSKKLIYNR